MENNKHIYIVSFGDSKEYRLEFDNDSPNGDSQDSSLVNLENELNAYLKEKFPNETFAYYTTPKVLDVAPEKNAEFESYPLLDNQAVEEIKEVLIREIKVMNSDKELNANAQWSDV